jgi:hypothetical protein
MDRNATAGKHAMQKEMCRKMECRNGAYPPSEAEISRYRQHGIAKLSFADMYPRPIGTCRIDLQPLLDTLGKKGTSERVHEPSEAWVQRGETPVIMISSGMQKTNAGNKPLKSHVIFDTKKENKPKLEFTFILKGHTGRANEVDLKPIYTGTPKATGELVETIMG